MGVLVLLVAGANVKPKVGSKYSKKSLKGNCAHAGGGECDVGIHIIVSADETGGKKRRQTIALTSSSISVSRARASHMSA